MLGDQEYCFEDTAPSRNSIDGTILPDLIFNATNIIYFLIF